MPHPRNDDPPAFRRLIEQNIATVLRRIRADAHLRPLPAIALAQQWHRQVYGGVLLPVAYYAGEVRDTDPRFPDLIGYEVAVGTLHAVASADVPGALNEFEQGMQAATEAVDAALSVRARSRTARQLLGVIQLASQAHGLAGNAYAFAASASMRGDHRPMQLYLGDSLGRALSRR